MSNAEAIPAGDAAPLRVMHVCAPAAVGGLERVVHGLSAGLARANHEVVVVAAVDPDADTAGFVGPLRSAGIRTEILRVHPRGYFVERRAVSTLRDAFRPAVMHTHGYRSDLLHGGAARRRGIATVTTLHGYSRMGGLSPIFEAIQKRMLRRFDGVVAVSEPLERMLLDLGVTPARVHHIPNAWVAQGTPLDRDAARQRLGLPAGGPAIGWVGRLVGVKGPDVFLRALSRLDSNDWHACVIGDGPLRPSLDKLADQLGLRDRVHFAGLVQDAGTVLSAFDVFVLSSHSEGTPIALMEAMAARVPVVATDVGGVSGLISGREDGRLVPPASPDALAVAIDAMLARPEEARAFAERAARTLETQFDATLWIDRHVEAYRTAMRVRAGTLRDGARH